MLKFLHNFFNDPHIFRRTIMLWAIILITVFIFMRVDERVLIEIGTPGASIILGIIGILSTVIGFFQWSKSQDQKKDDGNQMKIDD